MFIYSFFVSGNPPEIFLGFLSTFETRPASWGRTSALPKVTPTTSARSKSCSTCRKEWKKSTFLTRNDYWNKTVICVAVGCYLFICLQLENKWIQFQTKNVHIENSGFIPFTRKTFSNKILFKSITLENNCLRNLKSIYSATYYSTLSNFLK